MPAADGSTVTHILDNGQQLTYTSPQTQTDGTVLYTPPAGTYDTLRYEPVTNGGQYTMTYCNAGCGAVYDAQGRLIKLRNPHSSGDQDDVTRLSYTGNGLTAVVVYDADGHALHSLRVTSDPTSGQIAQMSDPSGRPWH